MKKKGTRPTAPKKCLLTIKLLGTQQANILA
jgi:hypothetical protein